MHGDTGQDKIYGFEGSDIIVAGDGKDRIFGGPGDDEIYTATTDASATGDPDNQGDFVSGGSGDD